MAHKNHSDQDEDVTQTIDLGGLFTRDVTVSGSFDLKRDKIKSFGKLLNALPIPVLLVDPSCSIIFANQACCKISTDFTKMLGSSLAALFLRLNEANKAESRLKKAFSNRKPQVMEGTIGIDKSAIWGRMHFRSLRIGEGRCMLLVVEDLSLEKKQILQDQQHQEDLRKLCEKLEGRNEQLRREISGRKRAEEEAEASRVSFTNVTEKFSDGIVVLDAGGVVLHANQAAVSLFGRTRDDLVSTSFGLPIAPGEMAEVDVLQPSGEPGIAEMRVEHIDWYGKPTYLVMLRDVTEKKRLQKELVHRATRDALTNLLNRGHFLEKLSAECERAKRYSLPLSLCLCDIDYFKELNDRHGHLAGDALLAKFGEILRRESRSSDLLGRYGGDEFIVALPHTSRDEGRACMDRVRSHLERTIFEDASRYYNATCSIGIAEFVPGRMKLDDLVGEADKALYEAKDQGRNRVVVLQPGCRSKCRNSNSEDTTPNPAGSEEKGEAKLKIIPAKARARG